MAGGADMAAVLDIVSDHVPPDVEDSRTNREIATEVVQALEASGYRIVRAGMVPKLEELEHTVEALSGAADVDLDVGTVNIADSRDTLRSLTELAVLALGLDPDDREQADGV